MVALGILLHAVGGFAAGSFYLPLKQIKKWTWESGWLVNGFFSWIIAPLVVALFTVPDLFGAILSAPPATLAWTFLFGLLWGIGGLTFGLSVRYLGMSLGYGVALGFCAAFGTIIPAIYDGSIIKLLTTVPGWVVLSGILVCLIGIGVCGYAGHLKEAALTKEEEDKQDFHLGRGLLVAGFAGLMSACMAFAFAAGKPIAEAAKASGTGELYVNNAVLVVSGDVTPQEVRVLAEKHYGVIPSNPDLPDRLRTKEPPQTAARRMTYRDARVAQEYVSRSYRRRQPHRRPLRVGHCRRNSLGNGKAAVSCGSRWSPHQENGRPVQPLQRIRYRPG